MDDFAAGETDKEDEGDDEDSGTSGLPVPGADPEEVKTYRVPKVSQNKFGKLSFVVYNDNIFTSSYLSTFKFNSTFPQ